jgi:hypothetical protein
VLQFGLQAAVTAVDMVAPGSALVTLLMAGNRVAWPSRPMPEYGIQGAPKPFIPRLSHMPSLMP